MFGLSKKCYVLVALSIYRLLLRVLLRLIKATVLAEVWAAVGSAVAYTPEGTYARTKVDRKGVNTSSSVLHWQLQNHW